MEIIKPGTKYDFIGVRNYAFAISAVVIGIGLVSLVVRGGPNYGVDFSGGTMMHVHFQQPPAINDLRASLETLGFGDVTIQDFGSGAAGGADFLIRLPSETAGDIEVPKKATTALQEKFGKEAVVIQRIEAVGPRVGADLRTRAILAVVFATVMMGVYLWARFELRFGIGAAVALLHDVLVTIGALSLFNYEVDLTIVAALLTIVGFSVNDTVVIADRIRENMRKSRRETMATLINNSINETLGRTILTTGTALMVLLALFFLGGNVINGFAFALIVGFISGVYSTVYVAGPIVLMLDSGRGKKA